MNSQKIITLFLLSFLLVGSWGHAEDPQASSGSSVPASAQIPATVTGPWSEGWYQGASGYDQAIEEYKQTQKPMVVYMSVSWCPYCRKFEKEVLSSPVVRDLLKDKIKVSIDPESGRRENIIAFQYGIRGFPSFFLHPPQPAKAVRLYTGVTPEQFVEFFEQVLG